VISFRYGLLKPLSGAYVKLQSAETRPSHCGWKKYVCPCSHSYL